MPPSPSRDLTIMQHFHISEKLGNSKVLHGLVDGDMGTCIEYYITIYWIWGW